MYRVEGWKLKLPMIPSYIGQLKKKKTTLPNSDSLMVFSLFERTSHYIYIEIEACRCACLPSFHFLHLSSDLVSRFACVFIHGSSFIDITEKNF